MKKTLLFVILLMVAISIIFTEEEIDYLLFLPNSSNQFVDEAQAKIQLDNVARYLQGRNLQEAQIFVYGYSADVANEIDPVALSRERALHVIRELENRGIARNFFTEPVGHGPVNLWGNNTAEESMSPNRRVRILFEDIIITPEIVAPVVVETQEVQQAETVQEKPEIVFAENQKALEKTEDKGFPWWWLLLLLLPLIILLWPKKKNKTSKQAPAPKPEPVAKSEPVSQPVVTPAPKPVVIPEPVKSEPVAKPVAAVTPAAVPEPAPLSPPIVNYEEPKYYHLTEEEIRNQAYLLFEQRGYQHGHHDEDWIRAIDLLFAKYEAQGYIVLWP